MKTVKKLVLFALSLIATIGILSTPVEELPLREWLQYLLFSKAIGGLSIFLAVKLYLRWNNGTNN